METMLYLYLIFSFAIALLAWMVYVLISKTISNRKIREEIIELFNAQEYGDALKFEYRGYTMLATFRPDIKISISHEKDIENVRAPHGMKLTPMFLIIKIKRKEEIMEKVNEAVKFIDSIPTQ